MDTPAGVLRLRGTVLRDGDVRDLFVVDGRITFEPQEDARTVAEPSGMIEPKP